ncbi:MAG: hypothetical protein HYX21_01850 [Candidatus Yanofskybacteria bacterium]|nr:hypothetical protein [Candidatus Yanofskybacteria bacterium]
MSSTIVVPDCLKTATIIPGPNEREGVQKPEMHKTVRLVVIEEGKVLLVHERGGEFTVKPAGWGLPGGGVDGKTEQDLVGTILKFLPIYCRVPVGKTEEVFADIMNISTAMELPVFLVGVKEGIEETGLIIRPERKLFEKKDAPDHVVVVVNGKILGGELSTRSTETDDCRWFSLSALPAGLYVSHFSMIKRSVNILGLDYEVSREVLIQEREPVQEEKEKGDSNG